MKTNFISKFYFRFLRPYNIPADDLPELMRLFESEGFIKILPNDRYTELPPLFSPTPESKKAIFKCLYKFRRRYAA